MIYNKLKYIKNIMDNYFGGTAEGVLIIILSKLSYRTFGKFCSTFVKRLCESNLTWRNIIKINYPEIYNSLFATNNLNNPDLISFYYFYKDNAFDVREFVDFDFYSGLTTPDDPFSYLFSLWYQTYHRWQDNLIKTLSKGLMFDLLLYKNWPGSYQKINEIIKISATSSEERHDRKRTPLEQLSKFSFLESLLYSVDLRSPIIDSYLINGKLNDYPPLSRLFPPSIEDRTPDLYMSHNFVFMFLYTREPDVDINNEPQIEELIYFLSYISKGLGYAIDWLIDKLNDQNVDIIYDSIIDDWIQQGGVNSLSKRDTIKNYYESLSQE